MFNCSMSNLGSVRLEQLRSLLWVNPWVPLKYLHLMPTLRPSSLPCSGRSTGFRTEDWLASPGLRRRITREWQSHSRVRPELLGKSRLLLVPGETDTWVPHNDRSGFHHRHSGKHRFQSPADPALISCVTMQKSLCLSMTQFLYV